jgi:hypothetical protein
MQSIIARIKIIVQRPPSVVFLRMGLVETQHFCPLCGVPVRMGGLCGTCYNEETSDRRR